MKRLYRTPNDRILGGVCGGIGYYFDIDPVIIRILWALFILCGTGLLIYIICWIIIPSEPKIFLSRIFTPEDDIDTSTPPPNEAEIEEQEEI